MTEDKKPMENKKNDYLGLVYVFLIIAVIPMLLVADELETALVVIATILGGLAFFIFCPPLLIFLFSFIEKDENKAETIGLVVFIIIVMLVAHGN